MSTPHQRPTDTSHDRTPGDAGLPAKDDYERTDVKVRSVTVLFLVVAGGVIVVLVSLSGLLRVFRSEAQRKDVQVAQRPDQNPLPPEPRLQEHPLQDYQSLVQSHEARLTGYGWNDKQKRTVHIPITRAMDLIVEKGIRGPGKAKAAVTEEAGSRKQKGSGETKEP